MELLTARLKLREFVEEDWGATWPYESNPDVVRYQSHGVRTPEESRKYIQDSMATARESPRRIHDLAVVLKEEGTLIGRCGLKVTDAEQREGALWFILDPSRWGKGYIPEAAEAMLDFGFGTLGLHRVWGDCDPRNTASIRVQEKLGMRREAHFRENVFLKGEWCDSLIHAILDREWAARPRR
ncbi:GNAT family N-acetyltransferase [Hyalangium rubrum]|uniref:GNAT family N-acetyltransferase n=1 Tax=Hyalangium rubrum TaxID=3103134 RepID=A0ABU5H712_9BACT|nr:GNAT family N-acetyltransferase [Hyalangium sp. s54d21]MDY7229051.1 GNAT family N-acetyltransferase [Hyalangium sp. s54d21]